VFLHLVQTSSDTLTGQFETYYDQLRQSHMIYLLTAIGLSTGGSITVHIYTHTIHRTTQITTEQHK